ncbi:MAG: Na-translocating system protein MpsC family protein [Desulfitobacteriaceae bacterium]|nr:Na-translocating system protein MpsC family protein [Desulfitobacteriaceae bacterium]MDD4402000.1 Na-translocating system protein MpsC family protein [Desulfitobacteriaceae bacterium]
MKNYNQIVANIKSGTARIYKEIYGQGPTNLYAHVWKDVLILKMEGVLTKLEQTLLSSVEGEALVYKIRNYFISNFFIREGGTYKQWLEGEAGNIFIYFLNKISIRG